MREPPDDEDVQLHGVRLANYNLIRLYLGGGVTFTNKTLGASTYRITLYRERRKFFLGEDARAIEQALQCPVGWMDQYRSELDPVPPLLIPLKDASRINRFKRPDKLAIRAARLRLLFPNGFPPSNLLGAALGLSGADVALAASRLHGHVAEQIESELGLPAGWFESSAAPSERELSQAQELLNLISRTIERRLGRSSAPKALSPEARALSERIGQLDRQGKLSPDLVHQLMRLLLNASK